jgi:hypothetical protein
MHLPPLPFPLSHERRGEMHGAALGREV